MGTNTIPSAVTGETIPQEHHNSIKEALGNDLVPRDTDGIATANQGDIGTSSLPFKRAQITSGFFFAGQILPFHSYNGALTPGHGWMKCDNRIVNEANYNTEHGAGSWATYIVSSLLDGKYLPQLTGSVYLVGESTTTQTGAAPITSVGNSSNQADLSHTHSHTHKWYESNAANSVDGVFDAAGSGLAIPTAAAKTNNGGHLAVSTLNSDSPLGDSYVETDATSGGGAAVNIQPESIEVIYYMRII